jgi:DNA-binding protein HU-beta
MNKADLVKKVAEGAGVDQTQAAAAIDTLTDAVGEALASGDQVSLPGLGIFEARARAAREGRNPQTGETMQIAATTVPAFKPAAALKRKVAGS